ncbi:MAG TPA: bifunctional diaminohydroxyphosphoribosylaminopyrimidine deaminase/5-amino-6-(5-phosphoribosylamino)uracil reductase RibD [Candidatus Hydrogenedentes bacterium]|nr:bifunctional diaminohydroxyphosphoribosylaminopyrimidine deaminase/5-amino-6-(5-phosphoribosylamino)uracil reductase RibD [Candidatus Hydrogenedentota bacterium]
MRPDPAECLCPGDQSRVFFMAFSDTDLIYMQRVLDLARKGRGRVSPNPMVGCVIVRGNQVLGEGWHEGPGLPHAEVNAVKACPDENIQGATVYVNLEPCAHYGKTPPCADFLAECRPARVVCAMKDPNPLVSGRGIARLRQAGIQVDCGLLEDEALKLNEVFVKFITTGKPFVVAKCAISLDGKIATRTGHSRWVTGEAARFRTHELRAELDAILVGSRTVMMDNPALTARLPEPPPRQPVRVILDGDDYLGPSLKIFSPEIRALAPTWVATVKDQSRNYPGADDILRLPRGQGGVDMNALMAALGERGITSVLIEGGGQTLASAFEAGVVDKICFFVAPIIIGGRDAVTAVEGEGAPTIDEAIRLQDLHFTPVGKDWLAEAYVAHGETN